MSQQTIPKLLHLDIIWFLWQVAINPWRSVIWPHAVIYEKKRLLVSLSTEVVTLCWSDPAQYLFGNNLEIRLFSLWSSWIKGLVWFRVQGPPMQQQSSARNATISFPARFWTKISLWTWKGFSYLFPSLDKSGCSETLKKPPGIENS